MIMWYTWILIIIGYGCLAGLLYKTGYGRGWEKGFNEGYELRKKHTGDA